MGGSSRGTRGKPEEEGSEPELWWDTEDRSEAEGGEEWLDAEKATARGVESSEDSADEAEEGQVLHQHPRIWGGRLRGK